MKMQENTPATAQASAPALHISDTGMFADLFDSSRFAQMQRIANIFSQSKLVPEHFRNDMPSCFVGIQMAVRLGVDPFMMLQNTYVVHGRPGMEAKLVIALINQRGPFEGPIQWEFSGEGHTRQCTAWAIHKKTGQRCEATVSWEMAEKEGWTKKTGSKWMSIPDLMFQYRSAAFLGRLYCPEVLMGLPTTDELYDMGGANRVIEVTPESKQAITMEVITYQELSEEKLQGDVERAERLEAFIELTAKGNGKSVEEIKAAASDGFDGFWKAFEAWEAKTSQAENGKRNRPTKEEMEARRAEAKATLEELGVFDVVSKEMGNKGKGPWSSWNTATCAQAVEIGREMAAEASQVKEETSSLPETVQCPNTGNVVRLAVECQACGELGKCPETDNK